MPAGCVMIAAMKIVEDRNKTIQQHEMDRDWVSIIIVRQTHWSGASDCCIQALTGDYRTCR